MVNGKVDSGKYCVVSVGDSEFENLACRRLVERHNLRGASVTLRTFKDLADLQRVGAQWCFLRRALFLLAQRLDGGGGDKVMDKGKPIGGMTVDNDGTGRSGTDLLNGGTVYWDLFLQFGQPAAAPSPTSAETADVTLHIASSSDEPMSEDEKAQQNDDQQQQA